VSDPLSTVRAFIAIELPPNVQAVLASTQHRLAEELGRASNALRWAKPEGTHLTLQFLGDVPVAFTEHLEQVLRRVCEGRRAFDLSVQGLGAFPNTKRPRVVWVGVGGDLGALESLASAVNQQMSAQGYTPDKPFSPHLTLGRLRDNAQPNEKFAVGAALEHLSMSIPAAVSFRVNGISLMKSDLRPGGAVYTPLAHLALER
jgi:RNA 2',3'-cyclic 3'-phosphodiesterase